MTAGGSEHPSPEHVLDRVMTWSAARDFAGHSKHDALNSPLLQALFGWHKFPRLAAIQAVMRAPINIRPWLGVPRLRNPKGIGLMAHAFLDWAEISDREAHRADCLDQARSLLDWLVKHASPWTRPSRDLVDQFGGQLAYRRESSPELKGLGWGYHYPWQDVGFFQPRHFPNRVVSSWIGFAFLRACELTGEDRYRDAAREIAEFLLSNPRRLVDTEDELCLSYVPLEEIEWAVMDVSVLCSALCAQLARQDPESAGLLDEANRLMQFVVDKQTDYGAWFYTWPAGDSHIKHDNYHTGIILDCIADTMAAGGNRAFEPNYRAGLDYYRDHLFTSDGAPRWMNDKTFPHDIHGAAAGVLCFTRARQFWTREASQPDPDYAAACGDQADRILSWTLDHLYHPDGYFHYQRTRWFTKRFCLMRWGNAWMMRALAQTLRFGQGE